MLIIIIKNQEFTCVVMVNLVRARTDINVRQRRSQLNQAQHSKRALAGFRTDTSRSLQNCSTPGGRNVIKFKNFKNTPGYLPLLLQLK